MVPDYELIKKNIGIRKEFNLSIDKEEWIFLSHFFNVSWQLYNV
jgi:hypothetical protein